MPKESKIPLIVANWKMNGALNMWQNLASGIAAGYPQKGVDVVLCPPFPALPIVAAALKQGAKGGSIALGAQNLYPAEKGAYTGEVSGEMLTSVGCRYVIIGHSERRGLFNEGDAFVAKKVCAAQSVGLVPILCVGEGADTPDLESFLSQQLTASLAGFTPQNGEDLIIAYEPVWAIGTGKVATTANIRHALGFIRHTLTTLFGRGIAERVRLLYGGSMTQENAAEILALKDVAGGLIGGASLTVDGFLGLINKSLPY